MPQSAARWTHTTKDATQPGKVCVQQPPPIVPRDMVLHTMPNHTYDSIVHLRQYLEGRESEDCLNMNIYAPIASGMYARLA
jgi:carboxylesterase type B